MWFVTIYLYIPGIRCPFTFFLFFFVKKAIWVKKLLDLDIRIGLIS